MSINRRRLLALCHKESLQIVRDPSSILIAFIMPVVLLVVMGYAINLDVDHLRLGIWRTDRGAPAVRLEQALRGSTALEIHGGPSKAALHQLSRILARHQHNIALARGDFFKMPWGDYDLVYAFLSPVPMPRDAASSGWMCSWSCPAQATLALRRVWVPTL